MSVSARSPRAEFRRFVGIALGGGRGKNTAVARLELTPPQRADERIGIAVAEAKLRYGQRGTGRVDEPSGEALFRDEVLVDYLERWVDEHTVVAIDAPLTLPPCIRCRLPCPGVARCTVPIVEWMRSHASALGLQRGRSDPGKPAVTPYTQRATGMLLAAGGLHPRETLGQGMGPLAARAVHLRQMLSPKLRLHENLLEVHPRATLIRLYGSKRERRTRQGDNDRLWETRKWMLASLTEGIEFDYVWPELVVRNIHVFYAVVCAFTASQWALGDWKGPRDLVAADRKGRADAAVRALGDLWVDAGWIWAPPADG